MAASTIHTNLKTLRARVPGSHQSVVTRLGNVLGSNYGDETPINLDVIRDKIGDFEADWVRSHTGCHIKVASAKASDVQPTNNTVADAASSVASTVSTAVNNTVKAVAQFIGGKKVPETNPEHLTAKSATVEIDVRRTQSGGRYDYDGTIKVDLSKMVATQVRNFAETMPDGVAKQRMLKLANEGIIEVNQSADVPVETA